MKEGGYILTGGTGFLGSLLGVELLKEGCSVFFLGRKKDEHDYDARQRAVLREIDPNVPLGKASFFEVDFESETLGLLPEALEKMRGAHGLYHLAAELSFRAAHKERVRKANFENLRHVMALAQSLNTQFFFVSTAYVHGKQPLDARIPEKLFPRPKGFHNAYEESKYDAEYFVKEWAEKHQLRYAILRPSIVVDREGRTSTQYGFSSFLIGIEKMKARFPNLLSGALSPLLIPFPYSLYARLNLVPADWVIRAMITIGEKNTENGAIFNLTNPEPVSIKQVITYAFEDGSKVCFLDFSAPTWMVRGYVFVLHILGFIIFPLRAITERLWLFRFYMTEGVRYSMENTNALVSSTQTSHPTLTNEELELVVSHFLVHYHRKKRKSS